MCGVIQSTEDKAPDGPKRRHMLTKRNYGSWLPRVEMIDSGEPTGAGQSASSYR